MNTIKNKKLNSILILGFGFLTKSIIKKISDNSSFNIICLCKKKPIIKYNNTKFIQIADFFKSSNLEIDVFINGIGNINHDSFLSSSEKKIANDHFYLPMKVLNKLNLKKKILFLQISSIDEVIQKNKKFDYYFSPYAFFKNVFSEYLLTLDANNFIDCRLIYLNSVYGPNQKKDRFIPNLLNCYANNSNIKITNPTKKRNFIYVEDFANNFFHLLTNYNNYKKKVIFKSKFDYRIKDIVNYVYSNRDQSTKLKKYNTANINSKQFDIIFIKEEKSLKFYLNYLISLVKND